MKNEVFVSENFPRLIVYDGGFYEGERLICRGNVGLQNLNVTLNKVESLRFCSTNFNATLILFSRTRFRGDFRVFRGNVNLSDLANIINGKDVESLISTNQHLTLSQVRHTRSTSNLPDGHHLV